MTEETKKLMRNIAYFLKHMKHLWEDYEKRTLQCQNNRKLVINLEGSIESKNTENTRKYLNQMRYNTISLLAKFQHFDEDFEKYTKKEKTIIEALTLQDQILNEELNKVFNNLKSIRKKSTHDQLQKFFSDWLRELNCEYDTVNYVYNKLFL